MYLLKSMHECSYASRGIWLVFVLVGCCLSLGGLGACTSKRSVTPENPEAAEAKFDQSETALTTAYSNAQHIVVVAYNDGTDTSSTVKYTSQTRTVLPGASMMGWSYSLDKGQSWKYAGRSCRPRIGQRFGAIRPLRPPAHITALCSCRTSRSRPAKCRRTELAVR